MGFGFGQLAAIGGSNLGVLEGLEQLGQRIGAGQEGVLGEEDDEVWGGVGLLVEEALVQGPLAGGAVVEVLGLCVENRKAGLLRKF